MPSNWSNMNEEQQEEARKRKKRRDRVVLSFKSGPCADCDQRYPTESMDFDHVRGDKIKNVSQIGTLGRALAEIEKCDLVCSNCHRVRTKHRILVRDAERRGRPAPPIPEPCRTATPIWPSLSGIVSSLDNQKSFKERLVAERAEQVRIDRNNARRWSRARKKNESLLRAVPAKTRPQRLNRNPFTGEPYGFQRERPPESRRSREAIYKALGLAA